MKAICWAAAWVQIVMKRKMTRSGAQRFLHHVHYALTIESSQPGLRVKIAPGGADIAVAAGFERADGERGRA